MGYNDPYKKHEEEWEVFEKWVDDCNKFLDELQYDGFVTNCTASASELSSYPSCKIVKEPSIVVHKIFTLPLENYLVSEKYFVRQPPALPPMKQPPIRIRLSDGEYPSWYGKFLPNQISRRQTFIQRADELKNRIEKVAESYNNLTESLEADIASCLTYKTDPNSSEKLIGYAHQAHNLPKFLRKKFEALVDPEARIALIEFEFPDYKNEQIITHYEPAAWSRNKDKIKYASETQKKKLIKACIYSLIIRASVLAAQFNIANLYDSIVVNVSQDWFDPATGRPQQGIIASLQASVDDLLQLSMSNLDPEACFKHLKGIVTPTLENARPVRPIFVMSKADDRIVPNIDVDGFLEPETNLAAMEWEDFEHLVAQLFEWEFAKNGVEVKVTRASRDRGVDAILFDPDPLKGGKYVLQAKRYTNTVDVASVRDLYGTVINEGANRGILITTSSFGPEAYEFAKDKPISLVDGTNLLLMLQRHGKKYRIDMDEARRMTS